MALKRLQYVINAFLLPVSKFMAHYEACNFLSVFWSVGGRGQGLASWPLRTCFVGIRVSAAVHQSDSQPQEVEEVLKWTLTTR